MESIVEKCYTTSHVLVYSPKGLLAPLLEICATEFHSGVAQNVSKFGKRVGGMFFTVFDFLKSIVLPLKVESVWMTMHQHCKKECIFVSSIFSPWEAGGVRHPSLLFSALVPASFWPGHLMLIF